MEEILEDQDTIFFHDCNVWPSLNQAFDFNGDYFEK